MKKEFTKEDLKPFMLVVLNDDSIGIVVITNNGLAVSFENGQWGRLNEYNCNMQDIDGIKCLDIKKVYGYVDFACNKRPFQFNTDNRNLLFERKEIQELTLAEVCKALGKEIKIVK